MGKVRKPVVKCTSDSIRVSWRKPYNSALSPTGYRLVCFPKGATDSEDEQTVNLDKINRTTMSFKNLKPELEYVVKIYTVAGDRESEQVKVSAKTGAWIVMHF